MSAPEPLQRLHATAQPQQARVRGSGSFSTRIRNSNNAPTLPVADALASAAGERARTRRLGPSVLPP
jgi:hypothetical protein